MVGGGVCGGARGGSSGRPQWVRIFRITSGWVGSMKLTIFMTPPQRRALKGIDLPDAFDQGCPSAAGNAGRWRRRGRSLVIERRVAVGLGAHAATLVRVEAEIPLSVPKTPYS